MRSRDDEIRATISKEEAIHRIKKLGGVYDPTRENFDVYDQLDICESLAKSTPIQSYYNQEKIDSKENVVVYGNENGGSKQQVNFELTPSKLGAISKLREVDYRTPPPEIASLLEIIFEGCDTKEGWWLAVGQQWNPRAISRTLNELIKLHVSGRKTFKNPAAYFTYLIKFRARRRIPKKKTTNTNGGRKQHSL